MFESKSLPGSGSVVLDGGHLLHSMKWPADGTYKGIAEKYSDHTCDL